MTESLFQRGKSQVADGDVIAQTAPLFAATPYLYDALKTVILDGKKVVKGCTIRIGFYCADVQVCVTDEHNHLYAYASLDPFKTLPEALEEILSSGSLVWKDSRGKR